MSRGRILYYCQSLVGIGHLSASLRIARELLPAFDIDFIQGGLDMPSGIEDPGWRRLKLPTLLHDDVGGGLVDPDGGVSVDSMWQARAAAIKAFLQPPYRAIVVEFFPFGRRRFRAEIFALFDAVRAASGPLPIFCNVREVLVPVDARTEQKIVAIVQNDIHTVFVRGDPAVITLGDTFGPIDAIAGRVVYTGYCAPPLPTVFPPRSRTIVVSRGGGEIGAELLPAVVRAAALIPDHQFVIAAGARTPAAMLAELNALVASDNVRIVPFLADFQQQLLRAALSINLGGDNTLVEVIGARTPCLAYPYQGDAEQGIRIGRMAAAGYVHALAPADLDPPLLAARIRAVLAAPHVPKPILADGARVTAQRIGAILAQR